MSLRIFSGGSDQVTVMRPKRGQLDYDENKVEGRILLGGKRELDTVDTLRE